jgi:hypothetical protein
MAASASFGLAGCGPVDDLKNAASRLFDVGKSPGERQGVSVDVLDVTPVPPSEQPSKMQASKAKKDKPPLSKVQRPQTAEKKPTSDTTERPKPQRAEPQSVPSQPPPSGLRTLWPEPPAPGTFSR